MLATTLAFAPLIYLGLRQPGRLVQFSPVYPVYFGLLNDRLKGIEFLLLAVSVIPIGRLLRTFAQSEKSSLLRVALGIQIFFVGLIVIELFVQQGQTGESPVSWATCLLWASSNFGLLACLTNRNSLRQFLWTWAVVAAAVAALAIVTGDLGASRSGAVTGLNANVFALFVGLGVVAAISLVENHGRRANQIILSIVLAFGILGIANSASTAGSLLVFIAVIIFVCRTRLRISPLFVIAPSIALALLLGTFAGLTIDPFGSSNKETAVLDSILELRTNGSGPKDLPSAKRDLGRPMIESRQITERYSSAGDRIRLVTGHLELFRDQPIWGYGSLRTPMVQITIFNETSSIGQAPHNTVISLLESYGIVGSAPILGLVAFTFLRFVRRNILTGLLVASAVAALTLDIQWSFLLVPVCASVGFFSRAGLRPRV